MRACLGSLPRFVHVLMREWVTRRGEKWGEREEKRGSSKRRREREKKKGERGGRVKEEEG